MGDTMTGEEYVSEAWQEIEQEVRAHKPRVTDAELQLCELACAALYRRVVEDIELGR